MLLAMMQDNYCAEKKNTMVTINSDNIGCPSAVAEFDAVVGGREGMWG